MTDILDTISTHSLQLLAVAFAINMLGTIFALADNNWAGVAALAITTFISISVIGALQHETTTTDSVTAQ